jgi:N-methylhydantoinase A
LAYRVAVDIGGTFTDLVVESEGGASVSASKVLTTPERLVDGVIAAVRAARVDPADLELFVHGTTAGLNSVLERRGAKVALVTTRGFRDTYLIGRGHRPQMYDLHYTKPLPLLGREAIFEVDERLSADGSELQPVDEASVRGVALEIRDAGFESVAVCLLHAYADGSHERRVGELLQETLSVPVVLSHVVAPVWREYERTATTVLSAYITPIMSSYLEQLSSALHAEGARVPVYVTESNGGVMGAGVAADKSVLTLFSGPVGGVVGTRAAGEGLELGDLISADVGGTSFDVSIVRGGEPALQAEFELQGLPVLAPAIEVHTIGAGGGSLIRSVDGALRVGPESAGANPGPACYGLGGLEPTVTDANLVLGRIPPDQRLAGELPLDLAAARAALARVGDRLGLTPEELAEQALEVVHFSMAEAIRELTVERGLDPRDFVLCAFGGAGGLHATALAEELGIERALVPGLPGAFSAWGMLRGDIRHDAVQTFFHPLAQVDGDLRGAVDSLRGQVAGLMELDGVAADDLRFEVAADLRYVGQEYSLTLPLEAADVDDLNGRAEAVAGRFHGAYQARYGHASPSEPIEFVAVRLAAVAELRRPAAPAAAAAAGGDPGRSTVRLGGVEHEAAVHHRGSLEGPASGPAIVIEDTATTVVDVGWTVRPVPGGHLLLERRA